MGKKVFFITNKFGCKVLHDSEGKIGTFVDSKSDIIETDEGLKKDSKKESLWFLSFDEDLDADKIERVKKLRSFKEGTIQLTYTEVTVGQMNNLKSTTIPGQVNMDSVDKLVTERVQQMSSENDRIKKEHEQLMKDTRRYGELFALIGKNGGGTIISADPKLKAEFEELKNKLGIEEEKEETQNEKS